jgi:hypothetical protein
MAWGSSLRALERRRDVTKTGVRGTGSRTLVDEALAVQEQSMELARAVTLGTMEMARVQTETAFGLAQAMVGAGVQDRRHEDRPPIEGYDELAFEEIEDKLRGLTAEQTMRLRDYERSHKNRPDLVERFDRSLV